MPVLILGALVLAFPIYVTLVASTHTLAEITQILPAAARPPPRRKLPAGSWGPHLGATVGTMMLNSLIMALGITFGKISISLLAAFAIVYFRFQLMVFFWMIFITLMLPVEVRILPTYKVAADLEILDSPLSDLRPDCFGHSHLSLPPIFHDRATNCVIDGGSPMQIFLRHPDADVARGTFVILFIYGWNQYLWPLLITSDEKYYTLLIGIERMLDVGKGQAEWHVFMASTILAMLPPVLVVIFMQKQFVRGMTETEK